MRKKEVIWVVILLIVTGVYVRYFTHWFEKPAISISASLRPTRRHAGDLSVVFTLNHEYSLTSLKVLPLEGDKFNPDATPVWHLISDSNSMPLRAFRYGQPLRGMKPALKGVHPDELTPGTTYRLVLAAGDASGYKDFKMPVPDNQ